MTAVEGLLPCEDDAVDDGKWWRVSDAGPSSKRRMRQRAASRRKPKGISNVKNVSHRRHNAAFDDCFEADRGVMGRSAVRRAVGEGLAMIETGSHNPNYGADRFGFRDLAGVHWNLGAPQLYEHALRSHEAHIAAHGPLVADTGVHTGRSPKDKFVVRD